jgi:transposase
MKFNAEYYCNNILAALTPLRQQGGRRRLIIHADNARSHIAQKCQNFCRANGLRLASHQPYSPDLALSDFFLFPYVKHRLQRRIFPSGEELLKAIQEAVTEIRPETLHAVFEE